MQLHCRNNTIVGIGGPSAPHVFALDRVDDLRATLGMRVDVDNTHTHTPSQVLAVSPSCVPGVQHADINTKFWRRRRASFGGSDVVLRSLFAHNMDLTSLSMHRRTKQNLSDANWQPESLLYLPASVADLTRGLTIPGQV